MLKNSKVAFISVIGTYHKTFIIKNMFLKLEINSCFCLRQTKQREISLIKILAIPFLLSFISGFSSSFSEGEIEFQLNICVCNTNSLLGEHKTMRSLLPADMMFISVIYLKVLPEFSLKNIQFAYLHRKRQLWCCWDLHSLQTPLLPSQQHTTKTWKSRGTNPADCVLEQLKVVFGLYFCSEQIAGRKQ